MPLQAFKKFMLFWAVCFLGGGLFFILCPHSTLRLVNTLGTFLSFKDSIPFNIDYFWLPLAGSMMMTISYLCYEAYRNPFNTAAVYGVLIAKAASSLFFIGSSLRTHQTLYLLGAVIDGPIFLAILLSYIKVKKMDARSSQ